MPAQRRKSYYFTTSAGRVRCLAYSPQTALALVQQTYPDAKPEPKAARTINGLDKRAIDRLARAWGITWPITISERRAEGHYGTCRTSYLERSHAITINPTGDHVEQTIRHELGHALDNEQRLARLGSPAAAINESRRSRRLMGYENSVPERAARAQENRDLHVKLTY